MWLVVMLPLTLLLFSGRNESCDMDRCVSVNNNDWWNDSDCCSGMDINNETVNATK